MLHDIYWNIPRHLEEMTSLLFQLYFLDSSWPLLLLICFLGRLFSQWQAFRTANGKNSKVASDYI